MLKDTVHWFHLALGHPGTSCLRALMPACYYNPRSTAVIQKHSYEDWRKYKANPRGLGVFPEQEVQAEPFSDVAVDLIGPWKINVGNRVLEFNALTCIYMALNLVK